MNVRARTWIYGSLLAAAFAAAVFSYWPRETPPRAPAAAAVKARANVDGEPAPDVAARANAPDALAISKWLAARSARYRELLRSWNCDVLVVPVQVESQGFDRATRQLMSADLASALSSGCVTPPALVDLALGEGLRRRQQQDVAALARELKAGTIVTTYAGHDRARHMRVTMQVLQVDGAAPPRVKAKASFENLLFTDEVSPFDEFHRNLPHMLAAVGLPMRQTTRTSAGQLAKDLPDGPKALLAGSATTPVEQAARLMLLGMLAPAGESPAGERAFAKAWVALSGSTADPTVQRMRARILFHLRQRPYALEWLKGLTGPEADGLRAAVDGNLPLLQASAEKVQERWERLFLELETYDLQHRYQRDADATAVTIVGDLGPQWAALGAARLADTDGWLVPDLVKLKQSLDETFPLPGQSLEDLVKGNLVLAQGGDPASYALLAGKHVESLLQAGPHRWCCSSFAPQLTEFDLLDLYDARVASSLVGHVAFLANVQGNFARAQELLAKYDEQIAGNPYAEELRARIEWELLNRGEIAGRDARKERIRTAARIAVIADPGQTPPPASGLWYLLQPPAENLAHILGDAYCEDFPVRSDWPGMPFTTQNRLLFSSSDIKPFEELLKDAKGDKRAKLLSELETRFNGDAAATNLRLDEMMQKGRLDPAVVQQAIAADPDNWDLYRRLASILAWRGEYARASEAARSYPGFARKARRTVELSNDADAVATMLYYSGAPEAARPLLKIAADYDNGSSASIRARARLAILDGDFATAAMAFLTSARRYNDLSDYRDFLNLLFAGGESADAWAGFDQLVRGYQGPQPWWSALVGHRRDDIAPAELRKWILDKGANRVRPQGDESAAAYAILEQLTDRGIPADGFVEFVSRVAGPSNVKAGRDGKTFVSSVPGEGERRVGPSPFGQERRTAASKDAVVPSRYPLLAQAWLALGEKRYDDAVHAFDRLAAYYDIESSGQWSFVLPYFALAAAQSADKLGLENHLGSDPEGTDAAWGTGFARAVFAAVHGNAEEASRQLDDVFSHRPGSGGWPVSTAFEYADICVRLSGVTNDDRYRRRALAWAREYRKIEPTYAWAHALTGWLATDEHERVEATAMAALLDPQSEWLRQVPQSVRIKAAAWTKQHAPFHLEKPQASNL